jgi:hypothetical protein
MNRNEKTIKLIKTLEKGGYVVLEIRPEYYPNSLEEVENGTTFLKIVPYAESGDKE